MKAAVFRGVGDIHVEDMPEPKIEAPTDSIVWLTASAICGTDLHDEVSDDQAILLSDIFPTGYFGADCAEITPGDTVAVFGCGPVGQFAILSAKLLDAGRILAIDSISSRLEMARAQGAEVIDFGTEHLIEVGRQLTGGIGVDRSIDAVGVRCRAGVE